MMRTFVVLIFLFSVLLTRAFAGSLAIEVRGVVLPTCLYEQPQVEEVDVNHHIDLNDHQTHQISQQLDFQVQCNTDTRVHFASLNGGLKHPEGAIMPYTASIGDGLQQGSNDKLLINARSRQVLGVIITTKPMETVPFRLIELQPEPPSELNVPVGNYSDTIRVEITAID